MFAQANMKLDLCLSSFCLSSRLYSNGCLVGAEGSSGVVWSRYLLPSYKLQIIRLFKSERWVLCMTEWLQACCSCLSHCYACGLYFLIIIIIGIIIIIRDTGTGSCQVSEKDDISLERVLWELSLTGSSSQWMQHTITVTSEDLKLSAFTRLVLCVKLCRNS